MLERNRTLQTLWLCDFKGVGGYIARGLIHNSTLTSLTLKRCALTGPDMESFGAMLVSNTSLKHLDLSGNQFSDTVLCHLATALEYNNTLKELAVDYQCATPNPFLYTTNGLEALAMTFLVNTSLESLGLTCVIGHYQLDTLVETLMDNGVLRQLLTIAIERTVQEFGKERTSHALYAIIEEWLDEYYERAATA